MPGVGDKQNARCGRQAECQVWETSRMPGVGDKQNARCGRQAECQVWETGRMPGVGDRQKCDCLSVQLLKTICRKFSEPVEEDVVMAIIKCTLTGLDTDW